MKGTDGDDIIREALRRGARPLARQKAASALSRLVASLTTLRIMTAAGATGEDVVRDAGIAPAVLDRPEAASSTSADTPAAAAAMADRGVDLLLFVGGDGTARDILGAVSNRVPSLGVPAGVKMHSAVFGTSPNNAGLLAGLFLAGNPAAVLRVAEAMDLDEAAIREDRVSTRLFGYASSPFERRLAQNAKARGRARRERGARCDRPADRRRNATGVPLHLGPGHDHPPCLRRAGHSLYPARRGRRARRRRSAWT